MRSTRTAKLAAARRAALTGETYQQALQGLRAGGAVIPDAEDAHQRQLEAMVMSRVFHADVDGLGQRFADITVRPGPRSLTLDVAPPSASWLLFAVLPMDGGEGYDVYGVPGLRAHRTGRRRWRLTTEFLPGATIHVRGPVSVPTSPGPEFTDELGPDLLLWTRARTTRRELDFVADYPSVLFEDPATSTLLSRLLRRPKFWTIPPPTAHLDGWYRGRREVHIEWNDPTTHAAMMTPLLASGVGVLDRGASDDYRVVIHVSVPGAPPAQLHLRRNVTDAQ